MCFASNAEYTSELTTPLSCEVASHHGTSCAANSESATFFAALSALAVLVILSMRARFANL